jgi:hypothetical protein
MPPAPRPLTIALQTTYAELLEQSSFDAVNESFPEAGTFVSKAMGGKRYWYSNCRHPNASNRDT